MLRRLFDGLLGAALAAPVAVNQAMDGRPGWAVTAVPTVVGAVVMARRWPMAGWLIVVLGTLADGNFVFAVPVLSYLVGLRTARIGPVAWGFAAIAAGGTALNLVVLGTGPAEWFLLAMVLLLLGVFPWLFGRYRSQRARLVSAGWERAARLEYERRLVVREARLRERARIAEEMHDSLGHELSLIALGAGALETAPGLAERHRQAATRIRESAATATDRLHEIIGVLRDEDDPAPLVPADEPVEALVGRAREAGLVVTLRRTGEPGPPAMERTAYRVVREALTNASRHAPGAEVEVTFTATTVSVENGPPPAPAGATTIGGLGLAGLAERVRLAGGTLTAGPTADGGFRTAAHLPPDGAPAAPPAADTEMRHAQRRARRSLAAALLTPAVLALVTAVGYYPFAVSHSVLERDDYDRIGVGATRADLSRMLPSRPVRVEGTCELYTDGNFPMASPTYRLCFTAGRLTSKERLS